MDYSKGKIYKIIGSDLIYYGSTIQTLPQRKRSHKNQLDCISKIIIEKGEWDMVLVELFPCENEEQLRWRERWYIDNNICINIKRPITTKEETKEEQKINRKARDLLNRDKLNKQHRDYVLANKEQINKSQREYASANLDKRREYRLANRDKINAQKRERYRLKQANNIL